MWLAGFVAPAGCKIERGFIKMNNNLALREIMESLKAGYSYGYDMVWDNYHNKPFPYPCFSAVLSAGFGVIRWVHFGSSANKCNMKELAWIISEIFKTTPCDFLKTYIRNDQSAVA